MLIHNIFGLFHFELNFSDSINFAVVFIGLLRVYTVKNLNLNFFRKLLINFDFSFIFLVKGQRLLFFSTKKVEKDIKFKNLKKRSKNKRIMRFFYLVYIL